MYPQTLFHALHWQARRAEAAATARFDQAVIAEVAGVHARDRVLYTRDKFVRRIEKLEKIAAAHDDIHTKKQVDQAWGLLAQLDQLLSQTEERVKGQDMVG